MIERRHSAAGDHHQRGRGGVRGHGNQADIGLARGQLRSAARRCGVADLVELTQVAALGFVFEVPHQRSRIEEVDSRHTDAALWLEGHLLVYLGCQQ